MCEERVGSCASVLRGALWATPYIIGCPPQHAAASGEAATATGWNDGCGQKWYPSWYMPNMPGFILPESYPGSNDEKGKREGKPKGMDTVRFAITDTFAGT